MRLVCLMDHYYWPENYERNKIYDLYIKNSIKNDIKIL